MFEKVQDNGGSCGALFIDLSKILDCIVRDILLAKLRVYGSGYNSLTPIKRFLSGRRFKAKVDSSYCLYLYFLVGVTSRINLGSFAF